MKKAMSACVAAGFALAAVILTTLWLTCNHVEITISTDDQRTIAMHDEINGMSDFAYGRSYHIRF